MKSTDLQTVVFSDQNMNILKDQVNYWLWSKELEIFKITYFNEDGVFYCVILAELENNKKEINQKFFKDRQEAINENNENR